MRWGIRKLRSGEWTPEIYERYLKAVYQILQKEASDLRACYEHSEDFKVLEKDLVAGIDESMAMFMEGIETFLAYLNEGNEKLLDQGLQTYEEANKKFYKLYLYVEDCLEEVEVKFHM